MNSPYLLLPIALTSLFFYLITFSLAKLSVIKISSHRKIWNVLLLITFLATALLGLILAIQINYRLKIPFLKQLLTLHVDFGIGMTMIAVFHFLWHWSYYINIFKIKKNSEKQILTGELTEQLTLGNDKISLKSFRLSAVLLGFTSIITQIVLLREFMLVFGGNELIIGIILANWMILTATGAYIGKFVKILKFPSFFISVAFILLGILPVITVFLSDYLKNIVFQPGIAFGAVKIVYTAAIVLIPFCLLSGFLFTYIATLYSAASQKKKIDKVYALESIGSIVGGLIFSYLLAITLSTFQILAVLFFINATVALLISKMRLITRVIIGIASIAILIIPFMINIDKIIKQFLFVNQELTFLKDTPFGNLAITSYGSQQNFFENNVLLFTTENPIANEEATHYAMIQHNQPSEVLLISGGISGITHEILKYDVERLDYVELNPWIFKIGYDFTSSLTNPKVNIIVDDARLFIRKTNNLYDIILVNLPEPVTAQINRYYTIEFYRNLKSILKPGGIVSFSLSSTANYMSDKAVELNSTILKTVKNVFNYVQIFPGEKNYYILSDKPLRYNIAGLFETKGIENSYVNQYYLDDDLIIQRSEFIMSALKSDVKINRDFSPVSYFNQINLWLSHFKTDSAMFYLFIVPLVLLFMLFLYKSHPANLGLFTAGFTASAMEILLIIVFQVLYGYIYVVMGAFFATFMAGLALGTLLRVKVKPKPDLKYLTTLQIIMILLIILTIPSIALLKVLAVYKVFVYIICFGLLFTMAFMVGVYFSVATVLQSDKTKTVAAGVYSVDLIGSAAGALITSMLLIPLLGLYETIVFTCVLSVFTLIIIYIKNMKQKNQ